MMTCFRTPILLLLLSWALAAQDSSAWPNLAHLLAGKEIRVTTTDGRKFRGGFESAAADNLVIATANSSQTLSRSAIVRISTKSKSHRARNALIGAGVGAAAGLTTGALADHSCPSGGCFIVGKNFGKEVFTPLGAIVGGLVGVLIPTGGWRDVYRSK
jgi:hypothetical protein